ncbi:MAG TPA: L-threonylcarbamoyladenylate synthase [Bacillota bacterium]|nr:L-threonylcarbamoyladenylate synthase [Bacillota bacterium]
MILNSENYLDVNLEGKVIVFPTDTVYGIGCLYRDIHSIKRIYDIKNRDYSKPMVILCANLEQVDSLIKPGQSLPDHLKKHWPGKLTIIFFKNEFVYDIISSGKDTVGIRIPAHHISLELLKKHGPMVVTSLNLSNEPPIIKFADVLKFANQVDYIVEGGDLDSQPSTVYDLTQNKVLRQGDIII